MATSILVLTTENTSAAGLVATIAETDPSIATAANVLQGAITVGLNRLLSTYTFPTNAAIKAALTISHVDSSITTTVSVTTSADDNARVTRVNQRIVAGGGTELTTADVVGAAARTGLAMLLGIDATLPPLRSP